MFSWWQFCIVQILSGPKDLSAYFFFFRSLIGNFLSFLFLAFSQSLFGNFLFLFSPTLLIGKFLSLMFSSEGKDRNSHPGSRSMVSWDFGSRLVEWLDMIYVRVLARFRDKRECPTLFPWHKCNNDDLEILCKTSHACTYADTQVSKNFGHVMLGLIIHLLYLSQPSVSKICSFINLCIYPSLSCMFEKNFHSIYPSGVYTFFQKLVYDQWILSKKSWKLSLFTSMLFFWPDNFYFYYFLFFLPSFSFLTWSLFFFLFFLFLSYLSFVHFLSLLSFFPIWKGRADEGAHYLLTSNHKMNEKRTKMVSHKNGDEITESHNAKISNRNEQ